MNNINAPINSIKKPSIVWLILIGLGTLLMASCSSNKLSVVVPTQTSLELDYPEYAVYEADIRNKTMADLDVSVQSKTNGKQIRGFGLAPMGKAAVMVEGGSKLVLKNTSDKTIKLKIGIEKKTPAVFQKTGEYISFTLQNTTASSIPLVIPTVMNPNLSPFSKSGVDLKVGQEIFFKAKGRKHLLLTVDNSIKDGDILNVAALIDDRKRELGLD